jgi:16S rRNA (guanine527-N7)-methyltransferase
VVLRFRRAIYNRNLVELSRIAELLRPFLDPAPESPRPGGAPTVLLPAQLESISIYIDILLRWNSRINLTAIRQPEEIVTRHFGESLFAARHLFPAPEQCPEEIGLHQAELIDVGSGAGFPGLPIKIWAPHVHLTLIESNQKKATFLREVVRALSLTNAEVFAGRAADFKAIPSLPPPEPPAGSERSGAVVTLRAVERFDVILPAAADLVGPSGRLAILIGQTQLERTRHLVPFLKWAHPIKLPQSSTRFLFLGSNESR